MAEKGKRGKNRSYHATAAAAALRSIVEIFMQQSFDGGGNITFAKAFSAGYLDPSLLLLMLWERQPGTGKLAGW